MIQRTDERMAGRAHLDTAPVAQICNLLYRRLAVGRTRMEALSGLQIRDTAQRGEAAAKGARVCDPQQPLTRKAANQFERC